MQIDSDLVIYRTTLLRTFQVVTNPDACRSRCIVVEDSPLADLLTLVMSLFDLQDVCIAIVSLATLDLPMVVDLIGIYGLKGPYCTLTMTDWFLQALSVIPRGSWGDVARRFTMIRWAVDRSDLIGDRSYDEVAAMDIVIWTRARWAGPSPFSTRRRPLPSLAPPPPPRAADLHRKFVSGRFDEENPFVQNSSVLLVQPDEGVLVLVVDRIGDYLPQSTEKSRVLVIPVGARHKCQQGIRFERPILDHRKFSKFRPRHRRLRRRFFQPAARTCAHDNHARRPRMVAGSGAARCASVAHEAAENFRHSFARTMHCWTLPAQIVAPLVEASRATLGAASREDGRPLLLRRSSAGRTKRREVLHDGGARRARRCAHIGRRAALCRSQSFEAAPPPAAAPASFRRCRDGWAVDRFDLISDRSYDEVAGMDIVIWTRARWAGPSPFSTRRRPLPSLAPLPPPRAAAAADLCRKFVSGRFDEDNSFVKNSSVLLVQPDEGVSVLVVDRIGDYLPQSTEKSRVLVIPVGARHKCQQGIRFECPMYDDY
ncbi:monosaccharide-sensing protein 2-like [Dorcoceras hygrometricum]|uniref:Monosaccharide-sensing protein 2-like n=1 Tax=Dorcoceras hygrometricum TaxID=472368 RepID=A0A2Z7D851_9LAMI|nr:monosaccharide-sensing protein 2-like [Dorcoceras hygrometricum]